MDNKYYTPSKEELHIGFEFEEEFKNPNWHKLANPSQDIYEFVKLKLDTSHSISRIIQKIKTDKVRVKFLDESDLEELGWNVHEKGIEKKVVGGEWRVHYLKLGTLELQYSDDLDWEAGFEIADVKVKNKSEMRKLMEMLNIV